MTELLDRLAATCDKQRVEIDALRAEVARLRGERATLHFTLAAVKAHMEETEQ